MEAKRWMKFISFVCMVLLCVFAFPEKADAAQVSLSVGDTTTVTLPDKASTIVSSQWSIAGNTDAVTITSRSKTSCTVKAVQATGSINAIVHCKYMVSGSAAWHLYDMNVSVGTSSGGSTSSGGLLGTVYFEDRVESIELDLAKPKEIEKQVCYSGTYSEYDSGSWECQQSGDGFQATKREVFTLSRYKKYTFKPLRVGTYSCTFSYYYRDANYNTRKIGERTFPVNVTCSHDMVLEGYKQESVNTDGFTGNSICIYCGETVINGVAIKTIASGTCGNNLTWRLNDQGLLRIEGGGDMDDFEESPWHSYSSSIKNVEIGGRVSSIGSNAFSDCTALEQISIPDKVERVGSSVFSGCTELNSVYFQGDAPQIAPDAFGEINAEVSYISMKNGWLDLSTGGFSSTLTWKDATYDYGECGEDAGWILDEDGTLFIYGTGFVNDYDNACPWLGARVKKAVVGEGITRIGNRAFYNCGNLEKVTLPQSLTAIGAYAFSNCTGLQTITFPVELTSIEDYAFSGCRKLPSVEFGPQLTAIGERAFQSCTLISEVEFPHSLSDIGKSAFYNCVLLKKITFRGNAPTIQALAFSSVTAEVFYSRTATGWVGSVRENYGGTLTWTQFEGIQISKCTVTMTDTVFPYTGEEVKPEVVVQNGTDILESDTDYRVYYSDCVESGTATVTIVGNGNYIGAVTEEYQIVFFVSFDANGGTVEADQMAVVNGSSYENLPLPNREGYTFEGWYTAADSGEKITSESIVALTSDQILYAHWKAKEQETENPTPGKPDDPSHPGEDITVTKIELSETTRTLWIDEEFVLTATTTPAGAEVEWSSSDNSVATVKSGKVKAVAEGSAVITARAGELTKTCAITVETQDPQTKIDIRDALITVGSCTYNKRAQTPEITVKVNGRVLIKDTDYTVSYDNNINAGNAAKVIIEAKEESHYTGDAEKNFVINKAEAEITAKDFVKTAGEKNFALGAFVNSGEKLIYESGNVKVIKIVNGNAQIVGVGTAKITITAAANNNYNGAVKVITIKVNKPGKVAALKAVSKKTGQVKVSWGKDAKASGYKVMYSTDKKFKNKKATKMKNIKKKNIGSLTLKGLKKGKTYYIKVCSYAKIGKKEISGKYSKVKKVKVK